MRLSWQNNNRHLYDGYENIKAIQILPAAEQKFGQFRAILGFVKTNINKRFGRVELRGDDGGLINKQEIHCYRS